MTKTYSELSKLQTYKERFDYLKLNGSVGELTFGWRRYLNQIFYRTPQWKKIRREVILRDNACDLGVEGYGIPNGVPILIHHLNPITERDIGTMSEYLTNPEYLISTVLRTHNAIHYGDESLLVLEPVIRKPNDTCPWKH